MTSAAPSSRDWRSLLAFAAAPLIGLLLYWRVPSTWFLNDDYGWITLPREVQQHGLAHALFFPFAQGTVRVLDRLHFLALSGLFGRLGSGPRAIEGIRHTLYHEKVHQLLTPKLQIFREIQVYLRRSAYQRSYILRYLEEALAETVAMLRTQGLSRESIVQGLRFPIKKQYNISWALIGTEARGILYGPVTVEGLVYNVYFDFEDEAESDQ